MYRNPRYNPFATITFQATLHFAGLMLLAALIVSYATELSVTEAAETALQDAPVEKALAESPSIRFYRTREEQREAGLQRRITPWLTVSGLTEGEVFMRTSTPRREKPMTAVETIQRACNLASSSHPSNLQM